MKKMCNVKSERRKNRNGKLKNAAIEKWKRWIHRKKERTDGRIKKEQPESWCERNGNEYTEKKDNEHTMWRQWWRRLLLLFLLLWQRHDNGMSGKSIFSLFVIFDIVITESFSSIECNLIQNISKNKQRLRGRWEEWLNKEKRTMGSFNDNVTIFHLDGTETVWGKRRKWKCTESGATTIND